MSGEPNKTLFRAPVQPERKPARAERRATATSDVTRVRPAWVAAGCAAVAIGAAWTLVPAGGAAGSVYGGPGPLTPPHVKAKLTCASCHGKTEAGEAAYTKNAKKACVGCHGPHPSTRGPHAKLAEDGVMGCTTCHTIHGPQSGVRLPDRGPAVRYGVWGETTVPELAFHSDRTVLVPTIPVKVCLGCHSSASSDPLARCRSHAGGGELEPTVCFDEHRTALPAATAAVPPTRDRPGAPRRPPPPKPADKDAVCAEQHFEDRSFAWAVAREVATLTAPPKRSATTGSLAPLGWGGLAGALGYAATAALGAAARRRKRSREEAAKPSPTAAPEKRRLPFIHTDRCLGCYACVDACPYGVLEVENYVAVVARPDACCGLVLCEQRCPNGSLVMTDGEDIVDRPRTTPELESAEVPGLYLAGDVTGVPLIKNAILQGSRATEAAVKALPTRAAAPVDLCIVGAGPAGISAALRAKELGASAVILEQGGVAQSIQSFPRGKLVFDQPLALPVAGKLTLAESSKEELLLHWMRIVRRERLDIREETRMVRVERTEAGAFRVEALGPDGAPVFVECRSVIVSIGTRGTPRRLRAPVETEAESKIYYHLADARSLAGQRIVVLGLGDSAMEAAIALSTQPGTSVTIVHRGATYSRGQPRNIAELERLRKVGRLRLLFSAEVDRVTRGDVVLRVPGSDRPERIAFDAVLVLIGSIPPAAPARPLPAPCNLDPGSPMKTTTLGLFASLGMLFAGGAVYGVTPEGGFGARQQVAREDVRTDDSASEIGGETPTQQSSKSEFTAGKTLKVEGRIGNASLLSGAPEDTFVLLQLQGDDKAGGAAPNVALSLVIDKSGSMRGTRVQNAISAAVASVDRLRDGDSVSVVAFDTRVETVVPITSITTSNRSSVIAAIRGIQLGGDTCVSCGIEEGLNELRRAPGSTQGTVMRMLVLSDGDANNGIRDVAGFRNLAQRAQSQNVSITTIGVDLEYNEKILAAIAAGSNGRHYFVESDRDLPRVFEAEAATLTDSVASNAVAEIDLAAGVELVEVFDRSFGRSGSRISVPLGSFSKGEQKTVLVKVRIPKGPTGDLAVAGVRVSYHDLLANQDAHADGQLGLELVDDRKRVGDLDGRVLDRLQRSETAAALRDANTLFSLGKGDEARQRLSSQQQSVASARAKAKADTADPFSKDVDSSFQKQEAELNRANDGFAAPPAGAAPAPRQTQSNTKKNAEVSNAFGL